MVNFAKLDSKPMNLFVISDYRLLRPGKVEAEPGYNVDGSCLILPHIVPSRACFFDAMRQPQPYHFGQIIRFKKRFEGESEEMPPQKVRGVVPRIFRQPLKKCRKTRFSTARQESDNRLTAVPTDENKTYEERSVFLQLQEPDQTGRCYTLGSKSDTYIAQD